MIGQAQSITCESSIPETIKDTKSTFILLHDAFCLRINLSCMDCSYHDRSICKLPSSNFWIWYFAPMSLSNIQYYWQSYVQHLPSTLLVIWKASDQKILYACFLIPVLRNFIIQLIFLQQYFPIPVPYNSTWYCTAQVLEVLLHGCYCTGPGATWYPSNHDVL